MGALEEDGVSDVFTVVVMFIVLVLSAALVHGYINLGLKEATHRRNQIKANHLRETFEEAYVRPHSVPALDAAAQHLILEDPVVENKRLHEWFDRVIEDFRPSGYGVEIVLEDGARSWSHAFPENEMGERYVSRGTLSVSEVGGGINTVDVRVVLFEVSN